MTKVHVATSRAIGRRCIEWAMENMPEGSVLVHHPDDSDVFISVMYAHLVSEEFIAPRRCYNFHPGLLPEYRGAGAYSWAIINGERQTGVTLHQLDVNIDTGPIIERMAFNIEPWDTAESLFAKSEQVMFRGFVRWWPSMLRGGLAGKTQDESKARTYYRKDLERARDLTRFVRAFTFEGKPPAYYLNQDGCKVELRL